MKKRTKRTPHFSPERPFAHPDTKRWQEQNRDAMTEYNAIVAERGMFGDGRRQF